MTAVHEQATTSSTSMLFALHQEQSRMLHSLSSRNTSNNPPNATLWDRFRHEPTVIQMEQYWIRHSWMVGIMFAVLLALVSSPPGRVVSGWLLCKIVSWTGTLVGTTLGVGLGLGLAVHVYEQLETWEEKQCTLEQSRNTGFLETAITGTTSRKNKRSFMPSLLHSNSSAPLRNSARLSQTPGSVAAVACVLEDEQTYNSLMMSAGYHTSRFGIVQGQLPNSTIRGQVLRPDQIPESAYRFDKASSDTQQWRAVLSMTELWPTLPAPVRLQLGKAIEYILRDFVGLWYCKMDTSCPDPFTSHQQSTDIFINQQQQSPTRRMLYSVEKNRPIPFLDALYESCAIVFGNLATRVEHVNLPELVLLKWMQVLAHTFKWYRTLRKAVCVKQLAHLDHQRPVNRSKSFKSITLTTSVRNVPTTNSDFNQNTEQQDTVSTESNPTTNTNFRNSSSNNAHTSSKALEPVSEMAMTKEFLFAGKLHRAVTFGLDVPSFLFADSNGKECGKPVREAYGSTTTTETYNLDRPFVEDEVLAARLFATNLLRDCETDYNRVVGYRMVRALVARGDFGSNMVSSLLTEIMGGCVLTPIMSIFTPEYLNAWLIAGLEPQTNELEEVCTVAESLESSFEEAAVEVELDQVSDRFMEHSNHNTSNPVGDSSNAIVQSSFDVTMPPLLESSTVATGEGAVSDGITNALTLALMDLQKYVDFEEVRMARANNVEVKVNWDEPGCRSSVILLVLIIESALMNGRCTYRPKELDDKKVSDIDQTIDEINGPVEVTLPEYESATYTQLLMELTGDIDAFEERVDAENRAALENECTRRDSDFEAEPYNPSSSEQSTLRTLVAAWLHTGQAFRVLSVLVRAQDTILAMYYHNSAFLRSKNDAYDFVRQIKALTGVELMVDTMTVLASPRLEETSDTDLVALVKRSINSPGQQQANHEGGSALSAPTLLSQLITTSSTPRFLDFHRNESFAASLRSERERRSLSWERVVNEEVAEGVPVVIRTNRATEDDLNIHKDLHHIARIFYAGTNMIALRDAARRTNVEIEGDTSQIGEAEVDGVQVTLMTVETACPRRRIEVPDDDSSFLLRAQPRPLNAVGVHRDQRNHDQSFKCFAATFEEPAMSVGSDHFTGGRYIRRCLVRYYPIDRTASITLQNETRRLDQRKSRNSVPDTITLDQSSRHAPFLSTDFLKERHLCQRWVPKGTTRSQSLLASSIMEPTDFTSTPRTGKAIDFVFRCGFYERPMLDLGGKHFTVYDSSSLGMHRADASSLELSDASLSAALLMLGSLEDDCQTGEYSQNIEMGKDGYPVVWMKFSRKQDNTRVEVKPYRTSFVRAALLITSARQEAQLRCLIKCVNAGSAKKATKALTDTYLRRTLRLVEYAGSASREKESLLLRDLKLGVNHIDRGQLRRNALLSPRHPTELLELSAVVEDAVHSADVKGVDIFGTTTTVFKIKCSAIVGLAAADIELRGDISYQTSGGDLAKTYKEEWVVYRSLKEFQTFHKHLKQEVSTSESSGTAGSRLVGAATAAFATTTAAQHRSRQRKMLIPSLNQASKTGALGITKSVILKRKEILAGYLDYLLSPGHLLRRCSELLLFLGAAFPLPPDIRVGETSEGISDPLGRTQMTRSVLQLRSNHKGDELRTKTSIPTQNRAMRSESNASDDFPEEDEIMDEEYETDQYRKTDRKMVLIPAIRNKIDKVSLAQVRKQIFELLRYQFGFENASFARNRMLAALKAASFAVASGAEFRKKLYQLHVEHVNSDSVAGLIQMLVDILWPNGVFYQSSGPTSQEKLRLQAEKAKELLHKSFPDQIRAILGQELTKDGMDIMHEMLQNRIVVKSMAYMLFDQLWLEVFPEIGDVLPCATALDINS